MNGWLEKWKTNTMKITLYMATTIDGFIAKSDGNSDWVSPIDTENFEAAIHEHGNIIVGSRTFKQYLNDLYPVEGVNNIVVTSSSDSIEESANVFAVTPDVSKVIELLKSKDQEKALLIGGGKTNGLFLRARLIDEIRVVVHPLVFGNGIKLFENVEIEDSFDFVSSKELAEGLVQLKYKKKI